MDMEYKKIIFTLIYWSFYVNYIACHLKDLGEKTGNSKNYALKDIEAKILGGSTVPLKQFPFNVQLYNLASLCSGSILTRKIVLTAAHCFDHNKNIAEMAILSHPRFVFDMHAGIHDVWDFKINENYNEAGLFSSDIAVIIIHQDFVFSELVQKTMISISPIWMKENETFTATGWGETQVNKPVINNTLREVELRFVPLDKCIEWNHLNLTSDMFCLYGEGKDTCKGDSGGGILWKGAIVGITSHGRGCGEVPGIYTNVYHFKSWIVDAVERLTEKYCDFHDNIE